MQKASHSDTSNLLGDFIAGDEDALKIIYDLHYHSLYHFSMGVINDDEQSKDFISESFITTWEKRDEFKSLNAIKNYLFILVRNRCYSHVNKIKVRRRSAKEILFLNNVHDNCFLNEQIRAELLNHSLIESNTMPPQMKKVFQLFYIEGLSQQEIADKLGMSIFTVRSQKFKLIATDLITKLCPKHQPDPFHFIIFLRGICTSRRSFILV